MLHKQVSASIAFDWYVLDWVHHERFFLRVCLKVQMKGKVGVLLLLMSVFVLYHNSQSLETNQLFEISDDWQGGEINLSINCSENDGSCYLLTGRGELKLSAYPLRRGGVILFNDKVRLLYDGTTLTFIDNFTVLLRATDSSLFRKMSRHKKYVRSLIAILCLALMTKSALTRTSASARASKFARR